MLVPFELGVSAVAVWRILGSSLYSILLYINYNIFIIYMSIVELPQIKNLTNEEIKVPDKCGMNNLPDGLPRGFFSMLAVGTSDSGKSNSVINFRE